MKNIEILTKQENVFYFHGFIYFLEKEKWKSWENLCQYFIWLLLIFDKILIPTEHIITTNISHYQIKKRLINSYFFKELLFRNFIITTIWSYCNDINDQLEIYSEYKYFFMGKESTSLNKKYIWEPKFLESIKKEIEVFKRNPTIQSEKASIPIKLFNNIEYEKFSFYSRNNDIYIPFSHEKFFISGDFNKYSKEIEIIESAKQGYIEAMPVGNGRIYRALVKDLEYNLQTQVDLEIKGPFIHPIYLTPEFLHYFFVNKLNLPSLNFQDLENKNFLVKLLNLLSSSLCKEFRKEMFNIWVEISRFPPPAITLNYLESYFENKFSIIIGKLGPLENLSKILKIFISLSTSIEKAIREFINFITNYIIKQIEKKCLFISKSFITEYKKLIEN